MSQLLSSVLARELRSLELHGEEGSQTRWLLTPRSSCRGPKKPGVESLWGVGRDPRTEPASASLWREQAACRAWQKALHQVKTCG